MLKKLTSPKAKIIEGIIGLVLGLPIGIFGTDRIQGLCLAAIGLILLLQGLKYSNHK